jgi:hypothetical protein
MDLAYTNGNGSALHEDVTPASVAAFDCAVFKAYLLSLLPPVLGAAPAELESLFEDDFEEPVTKFAGEGGDVIYVVKRRDEVVGASAAFWQATALGRTSRHTLCGQDRGSAVACSTSDLGRARAVCAC